MALKYLRARYNHLVVARRCIVSRDVAAHPILPSAVSPLDHFSFDNPRRAGDCVGLVLINGCHLPKQSSRPGVQRSQPPVQRADIHVALEEGLRSPI